MAQQNPKRSLVSRRQFLRGALGASAATTLLAACGGAPGGQAGATQAPGQAGGEQQVSALMWSNTPVMDGNFKKRVEQFNAAQSGKIKVTLQLLPYDQYWPKIDLAYSSKKPYDTYFWDVQAYGHYKAGLLSDLQPYVDASSGLMDKNEYPVALYDNWRFDGSHLFALPENLQTMGLYYNKDLFDAAGVKTPDDTWTWEMVRDAARKLTKSENGKPTQWGFSLGELGGWWGVQTLAWALGGSFVDKPVEPTRFELTDAPNVQAMQYLQDMIWKEQLAPTTEQASAVAQDTGIFQTGKVAMFPGGSWNISAFKSVKFKWDIAPIPKGTGERVPPFWFGGWVIPKTSKVPDAAFAFARWSATDYQKTMATDLDWIPIQKDARESDAMKQGMPPGMQSVLAAINGARLGDIYHRNGQKIIAEVFNPTFEQLWNNKIAPADAAKQIDDQANPLLK